MASYRKTRRRGRGRGRTQRRGRGQRGGGIFPVIFPPKTVPH
jgi:hypothetical protein